MPAIQVRPQRLLLRGSSAALHRCAPLWVYFRPRDRTSLPASWLHCMLGSGMELLARQALPWIPAINSLLPAGLFSQLAGSSVGLAEVTGCAAEDCLGSNTVREKKKSSYLRRPWEKQKMVQKFGALYPCGRARWNLRLWPGPAALLWPSKEWTGELEINQSHSFFCLCFSLC